jgi:hypothetical protein
MKILEDKVTVYPPHALCRADVRMIFSLVPAAWVEDIEIVRLSAAQSHFGVASYRRYDQTFTIASRGHPKEHTLDQVLTQLAAHGLGLKLRTWHRLQARDVPRVQSIVAPLAKDLLPKLSQKKVWLDK